jgi:hypothetical protein
MKIIYLFLAFSGVSLVALVGLRLFDWRADQVEWARLAELQPKSPLKYDPKMVADLPEPAQRFFNFAITPGTPLLSVAEIKMGGQFSLGTRDNPDYQTMEANQILASPHGFVWRLNLPGMVLVSGSDSGHWTRFRILGLIPVARMGGDPDHTRSAYGRYVAESIFWTPAAVLPGPGVAWEGIDSNTARVTVSHGALSQTVTVKVGGDGHPVEVSFLRWSNANSDKEYRLQPFGGSLSDFREVQGYRLPFKVEAGNMFGTEGYFAFYRAEVTEVRFPRGNQSH